MSNNPPEKISRGPEQIFFHKRHIDDQQVHEKMFNITNQKGNAGDFPGGTVDKNSPANAGVQLSRSVMSNSLRPHELQHARPPCPSPTPGVYSNSCPLNQ